MLPPHISQRIRDVIAGAGGTAIDDEARGHGAIALLGTIGATWMLRPDGTLWDADADSGKPLTPLPQESRTMALVWGVERFPWLAELLPQRTHASVDCAECEGRGRIVAMPILCPTCQGLGWR